MDVEQGRAALSAGLGIVPIDLERATGSVDHLDHSLQRRFAQKSKALFRHVPDLRQIVGGKGRAGHEFQQRQQRWIDQRQSGHFFFATFFGFAAATFFAALAFTGAGTGVRSAGAARAASRSSVKLSSMHCA